MASQSMPTAARAASAAAGLGMRRQHILFVCSGLLTSILFRHVIRSVAGLALEDDRYTFILVIPLLVAGLIAANKAIVFALEPRGSWTGAVIVLIGLSAYMAIPAWGFNQENALCLRVLAIVGVLAGLFGWCYGTHAARAATFPLSLLLFMVPVPSQLLEHIVVALQRASAQVSYELFKAAGVPVFRDTAVRFTLPGVSVEVAEECSGIRSSLSLFISSLVAGYMLLRSSWSRVAFSAVTIPIVIFKNAARIVTLSLLGVYVDPGFLLGRLHRYSGLPFSVLALALAVPFLFWLRRIEKLPPPGEAAVLVSASSAPSGRGEALSPP